MWAIKEIGGYETKKDIKGIKSLKDIFEFTFWIKALTLLVMFLIPILIGLAIDGVLTLMEDEPMPSGAPNYGYPFTKHNETASAAYLMDDTISTAATYL